MKIIPPSIRFWKYVQKLGRGKCWEWIGSKNTHGYGKLTIRRGEEVAAHRLSWVIHFGEIPIGLWVLHHCDNPSCVNPKHLFLGTQLDNAADMVAKSRHCPGEKNGHSKLTAKQVIEIRKLRRTTDLTLTEIAKRFNVSPSAVHLISHRRQWKHI